MKYEVVFGSIVSCEFLFVSGCEVASSCSFQLS